MKNTDVGCNGSLLTEYYVVIFYSARLEPTTQIAKFTRISVERTVIYVFSATSTL